MRAITLSLIYFLGASLWLSASQPRAQFWKPENTAASQRLGLEALTYIVLPEDAGARLEAAVDDLIALSEQRYGQVLEVQHGGYPKNAYIFQRLDEVSYPYGAFSMRREGTRVFIRGGSQESWVNAIYAIAGDLLGARWYWAGEDGFEWFGVAEDTFPERPWRESPDFIQRQLHPVDTDFARRNRLNKRFAFNHNLAKVFTPKRFETEPEMFASLNGRRKVPKGHGGTDPQPDFTHPRAVELAAQAALAYFEAHPTRNSYSLSINDNVLFDTSERTELAVSPLEYFRGRPNYTDLVFGFMNQVAERVFDEAGAWQTSDGRDRYLTALAYYWTEPAPKIKLHPRVMPVLTSDRAQWHDPEYRAQDQALIAAWTASGAERVATWDYYFGAPYPYPRQFNQWIAESLTYLHEEGVDVFFSQLPSFWELDGAKAWFAAGLLWDASQDAECLLDEYYGQFFGAAAEPMRAFYEVAEWHRDEHEGPADWIKLYKDEAGIDLLSPELMATLRAYLEQALDQVDEDERRLSRVQRVARAFRITELYAAYQWARRDLVNVSLDTLNQGATVSVGAALAHYQKQRADYRSFSERFYQSLGQSGIARFGAMRQSDPIELAEAAMGLPADQSFRSILERSDLLWSGAAPRDFLGPDLPQIAGWHLDFRASEGFSLEPSAHGEGNQGLRIEHADIVSFFRPFPVVGEKDYLLKIDGSWRVSLDNRVHLHIRWTNLHGQTIDSKVPLRLPIGEREARTKIELPLRSPPQAYDLTLRIVVSRQYPGDYLDLHSIDFGALIPGDSTSER